MNGIELRDGDPLHGGKARLLAPWSKEAPSECPMIVRRGHPTNPFLGPNGWQQVEHTFYPVDIHRQGGTLVLCFGPDLVDNALRDDDLLQISLPNLAISDVITWTGITRSISVVHTAPPPQRSEPPPAPLAPPMALAAATEQAGHVIVIVPPGVEVPDPVLLAFVRAHLDQPALGRDGWQRDDHAFPAQRQDAGPDGTRLLVDLGAASAAIDPGQSVEVRLLGTPHSSALTWPVVTQLPSIQESSDPRPRWPLMAALLLLLVTAGAWAWWWMGRDADAFDPQLATTTGGNDPEDTATQEDQAAAPAPAESAAATESTPPAGNEAAEAHARARAALAADDCSVARPDMRLAAGLEYGPALLDLAEAQDSLDFQPCLAETINDVEALRNYGLACTAQTEGAPDALTSFLTELERQANAGEGAAADVLRLAAPAARDACAL